MNLYLKFEKKTISRGIFSLTNDISLTKKIYLEFLDVSTVKLSIASVKTLENRKRL